MKRETKIRMALFGGSLMILLIVAVFLWLINGNRGETARATFFTYMTILGLLACVSLALFFAFAEVFDQNGNVYTSRIITMLVTILMLVQLALAFSTYTNTSMEFSFLTFEQARDTVHQIDAEGERAPTPILTEAATSEFVYMAIADEDGVILYSSDESMVGQPAPDDGALSFILYSGHRLLAEPSEAYNAHVMGELLIGQLTLLVISLMFSVEFVMFIVGRVSDIGVKHEAGRPPAILTSVRQIAFLFYFASRLSASFIPVMARALPAGGVSLDPNMIAALPQTAETLFTCFAILFTNGLLVKRGWKPPFLLGALLVMLGTLLCALAPTLVLFTAARALIGLGYGFCWMTLRSVALFGRDESERLRGFSMLNAGLYAGMFCGSTVGSIIAVTFGYNVVLFSSAALIVVCGLYILTMRNQKMEAPARAESRGEKRAIPAREWASFIGFLVLMIAPTCIVVSYSGYFLPLFYDGMGRGALDVGRAQLLYGLLIVYLGPVLSKAVANRGRNPVISNLVYNLLLSGGLIYLGLRGNFAASIVAIACIAVGDGFGFGIQNTYFLAMSVNRRMGDSRALMYMSLAKKLMEMLGPTVFAFALSGASVRGVFVMGVLFALAACAYALFNFILRRSTAHDRGLSV